MRLFKRISSTVLSSVDKVISEVENHDAVIESMLQDLKSSGAQCKVRLNRVDADGRKMNSELQTLQEQEQQWTTRATVHSQDQEEQGQQKALVCLERRMKVREQINHLQQRLSEHQKIKHQLQDQLKTIDSRFSEINNKRHLLQSQQSVAEANRVVAAVTCSGASDIDSTFDRWEVSIAKMDVNTDFHPDSNSLEVDELAMEYQASESKQELLEQLETLKADASNNNEKST